MPTEHNYSQIEKEALAIMFVIKNSTKSYLDITLITDHKSLVSIIFDSKEGISVYTVNNDGS